MSNRLTQAGAEVLAQGSLTGTLARVSQAGAEVLTRGNGLALHVSQAGAEVLTPTGAGAAVGPGGLTLVFDEVQFPPDISFGAQGGAVYKTVVVIADSGYEQRVGLWARGRLRWDVSHGIKHAAQGYALATFFRARQGRLRGFRFKDWTDYTATNEPLVNNFPNSGGGTLQLQKAYTDTANSEVRLIQKPVAGTVTLTRNTVAFPSAGHWTLDTTTGQVTLTTPDTAVYAWSGQFDVPVRFDTDEMKLAVKDQDYYAWEGVPVVELRL